MPSFPRATLTQYDKSGGLKQPKSIVSQFWRLEVRNQGISRALLASGAARDPWPVAPSFQSLPPPSHGPEYLYVSPNLLLLIRTSVTEFRAHTNSVEAHLNLITSVKILFPNKVTFWGSV